MPKSVPSRASVICIGTDRSGSAAESGFQPIELNATERPADPADIPDEGIGLGDGAELTLGVNDRPVAGRDIHRSACLSNQSTAVGIRLHIAQN